MAGQSNGQNGGGAGMSDVVAALAPLAALAAPQGNQNIAYMLAMLQRSAEGRREQEEARRKQERSAASSAATARTYADMGLQVDPTMSSEDLGRVANTQIAMATSKRQQEELNRKARQDMLDRESLGKVAAVRGAVGTELPDVLQSALQTVPATGSEQDRISRGDTLTDIRESAKRLEMARSVARPFQETETFTIGGPKPAPRPTFTNPFPAVPPSLGADAPGFTTSLTTVPENVHALQRRIMTSGALPDASEAGSAFNIPASQYPGGQKLLDEQRKARTEQPFTHFSTDDKGAVTPITMQNDPETGERVLDRGKAIPGVGKTKRAPTPPSPTESTTTRTTAPRPIRDPEELVRLDASLGSVVSDVTTKVPGFGQRGASTVEIPEVGRVPKTKVLERAFFQRHGTEVTIRWDGKKFVIVRAWEPARTLDTTTTRGPASREPSAERDRDADED